MLATVEPLYDDFDDIIGDLRETNEQIDGMRGLREYTKSANRNDGGFEKKDDVLFFSKIDNQYIAGVIKDKKKDKLTKDYVYKIQKIHKRDPDLDEELSLKKRSMKEDPRVEIIKLREQRAKKQATLTWNVQKANQSQTYFKIMSANDYQIELQIALLKILKKKVSKVLKRRGKAKTFKRQATKIGNEMLKSQQKRDRKQRMAQTFSGSRQEMMDMSKGSKNQSDNAMDWTKQNVLQWLKWISTTECFYEKDKKLSDEERKNFKIARTDLFDQYFGKFVNADIDGKQLSELDNVSLSSKVYMNNVIERKIMIQCLFELFGGEKKAVSAAKYRGTEYDFSKDFRTHSDIAALKWEKKKKEASLSGALNRKERHDNSNRHYKGTEWTQDIEDSTQGGIYGYKANKHSKHESFMLRKQGVNLKRQTVSQIGINEDYTEPEWAEAVIADTMKGQATDERLRINESELTDELIKILLHANVYIPPELTTPVTGYHTIQNRNAQLRNLLLKHQALLEDGSANPELMRVKKLQKVRKEFERKQERMEMEAIQKGDLREITKTYGVNHKKIKQIKQAMKEHKQNEKRLETGRKYKQRREQNMSSLALTKKRKQRIKASSLALNNIGAAYNKKNKRNSQKSTKKSRRHSRKRSNSIDTGKLQIKNRTKSKSKNRKKKANKRPLSANMNNRQSMSDVLGFTPNISENEENENEEMEKVEQNIDKNENDILVGLERMHSTKNESMVIHSRVGTNSSMGTSTNSLSFDDTDENDSDSSSELQFSDDDDENDDSDGDGNNSAVPLSVQRLRAQERALQNGNKTVLATIMSNADLDVSNQNAQD